MIKKAGMREQEEVANSKTTGDSCSDPSPPVVHTVGISFFFH